MAIILPQHALVLDAYAALVGEAPGNFELNNHLQFINNNGVDNYKSTLDSIFTVSTAQLATTMLNNLQLGNAFTQADAEAYLNANSGNRVAAMLDLAEALRTYQGDDIEILKSKGAYVSSIESSYAYSISVNNPGAATLSSLVVADGQVYSLTPNQDILTGTAGDDIFYAFVQQNQNGANANSFSTGDVIDGGAGNDKIIATLINDRAVEAGNALTINARTDNVEEAHMEVLSEGILLDAGRMDSIRLFMSDNSDRDLDIQDVRLGSKLAITKDITFGLRDVDTGSGLTASFDSASFVKAGNVVSNSQIVVEAGYESGPSDSSSATPVKNLFVRLKFTAQDATGANKEFDSNYLNTSATSGAYPDTYAGLKDLIADTLAAQGFTNLKVELGNTFTSITTGAGVKQLAPGYVGTQITITDPAGNAFEKLSSSVGTDSPDPDSDVASRIDSFDPTVTSNLIETNVILDNAGRSSTAGDVIIGGMSNSNKYIEKANVFVDRSSKIDELSSATDMKASGVTKLIAFDEIEVTSIGAKGNLSINEIYNTQTFNASAFEGSTLSVGGTVMGWQEGVYNYTTSASADTIDFVINNDAIDKLETGVNISTGAGNDNITLNNNGGILSYATMAILDNTKIDAGTGDDKVTVMGNQRAVINAGDGNDFVHIDSTSNGHVGNSGIWAVGQTTGAQTFAARVLYQAKLTVVFAGFESTVTVATNANGNFVATQRTLNDAIKKAIADSPELSKLLTVSNSTNDQQIIIESTVGGENNLAISVYQPTLTTGVAGANQVKAPAGADLVALEKGLINTTVGTSAHFDTATKLVAEFNGDATSLNLLLAGNVDSTGVASVAGTPDLATPPYMGFTSGGSVDDTIGNNFSVIDAGTGNDLVVFHSNDTSANVLKISGAFGKTSVVNFHDLSPDAVTLAANVGNHALDFTSWLDTKVDPSNNGTNQNSAIVAPITLNIAQAAFTDSAAGGPAAVANSVSMLRMDETAVNSIKFADLTAAALITAVNTSTAANTTVGGIDTTHLNASAAVPAGMPAGTAWVGNTLKYIVMVENMNNVGEYKVFQLTAASNTTGTFATTGTLLGTLDFGASINFNLVGSDDWSLLTTGLKLDGTPNAARLAILNPDGLGGGETLYKTAEDERPDPTVNDDTTVDLTQTATWADEVVNKAGNLVPVSSIKTIEAGVELTVDSTQAMSMNGVTGDITISDFGGISVVFANTIDARFSGVVTADLNDTLANLTTLTGVNNYSVTLSETEAAAADLLDIAGKFVDPAEIDATSLTDITGSIADATTVLSSAIDLPASVKVEVDDTAAELADLVALQAAANGMVDASTVVTITEADTINLTNAASFTWAVDATIVGTDGNDSITVQAANGANIITGGQGDDTIELTETGAVDTIVFANGDDSKAVGVERVDSLGVDTINNFSGATDKLAFATVDFGVDAGAVSDDQLVVLADTTTALAEDSSQNIGDGNFAIDTAAFFIVGNNTAANSQDIYFYDGQAAAAADIDTLLGSGNAIKIATVGLIDASFNGTEFAFI